MALRLPGKTLFVLALFVELFFRISHHSSGYCMVPIYGGPSTHFGKRRTTPRFAHWLLGKMCKKPHPIYGSSSCDGSPPDQITKDCKYWHVGTRLMRNKGRDEHVLRPRLPCTPWHGLLTRLLFILGPLGPSLDVLKWFFLPKELHRRSYIQNVWHKQQNVIWYYIKWCTNLMVHSKALGVNFFCNATFHGVKSYSHDFIFSDLLYSAKLWKGVVTLKN